MSGTTVSKYYTMRRGRFQVSDQICPIPGDLGKGLLDWILISSHNPMNKSHNESRPHSQWLLVLQNEVPEKSYGKVAETQISRESSRPTGSFVWIWFTGYPGLHVEPSTISTPLITEIVPSQFSHTSGQQALPN